MINTLDLNFRKVKKLKKINLTSLKMLEISAFIKSKYARMKCFFSKFIIINIQQPLCSFPLCSFRPISFQTELLLLSVSNLTFPVLLFLLLVNSIPIKLKGKNMSNYAFIANSISNHCLILYCFLEIIIGMFPSIFL